ncbi:TetR/AcrR family transcriptional regulator [Rhodococcoides kyotonense]|uniref:DNA-binding transcriptional regulator, AcrR family n=1 Tax=Rhodococcoides kyotonense TaxID=398843 RepID=A0A239DSR2_9NOCA|nr:TetR family transcriptional regulator [Rhodococcus kyotonensis]SNS35239.1 DNA-binding transcriptional regulator, AcrR family [Rhodococcus kyotonensis]
MIDGVARPRSATATRAAILDAARTRFGNDGYERTTMRAVAGDVGVDAAMVVRYFKTKDALFAEAASFELHLPDLHGIAARDLASVLMPRFFDIWEADGTFLALLRAAATSPVAAQAMLEVFASQVAPALSTITPDRHAERAALVGSQILGLAFSRYVLRVPPLVTMSHDDIVDWVGPTLTRYLTG